MNSNDEEEPTIKVWVFPKDSLTLDLETRVFLMESQRAFRLSENHNRVLTREIPPE